MPKRKRLVDPHGDIDTAGVPDYPDMSNVDIIKHLLHYNEVSYHSEKQRLLQHLEAAIAEGALPKPKKGT